MRVAIYIRTARHDAAQAADQQRAALHRLAAEQGWQPVGEYADRSQPGLGLDRPGLTALLNRVDQRKDLDAVAVYDLSRLTRDPAALLALHRRLADRDVKIVSPVQPDGHDATDVPACLQIWLHPLRSARPHLPVAGHHREVRP